MFDIRCMFLVIFRNKKRRVRLRTVWRILGSFRRLWKCKRRSGKATKMFGTRKEPSGPISSGRAMYRIGRAIRKLRGSPAEARRDDPSLRPEQSKSSSGRTFLDLRTSYQALEGRSNSTSSWRIWISSGTIFPFVRTNSGRTPDELPRLNQFEI